MTTTIEPAPSAAYLDFANAPDPVELTAGRQARVDFDGISRAALARLPDIVQRWLPGGRLERNEWVARNPTRADRRPGSFKINLRTGCWSDFATGHAGRDVIALAAYLDGLSSVEAAERVAEMLGMEARQ